MARQIRPRRTDWPAGFWQRASSSYADLDLLCRACDGRGCSLGRDDVGEDTTVEDVVCDRCRDSGLMIQARELGSIDAAIASDEAGGAWLDFVGHLGDGLVWPMPWTWSIDRRRFPIKYDVYFSDKDVIASMVNKNVLVGLFSRYASSGLPINW